MRKNCKCVHKCILKFWPTCADINASWSLEVRLVILPAKTQTGSQGIKRNSRSDFRLQTTSSHPDVYETNGLPIHKTWKSGINQLSLTFKIFNNNPGSGKISHKIIFSTDIWFWYTKKYCTLKSTTKVRNWKHKSYFIMTILVCGKNISKHILQSYKLVISLR